MVEKNTNRAGEIGLYHMAHGSFEKEILLHAMHVTENTSKI
jgi:hypothetical protein